MYPEKKVPCLLMTKLIVYITASHNKKRKDKIMHTLIPREESLSIASASPRSKSKTLKDIQ